MKKKIEVIYIKDKSPRALQRELRQHDACEVAREFCKGKSLKQAWRYCRKWGWLWWYMAINIPSFPGSDLACDIAGRFGITGGFWGRHSDACKFIRARVKVR